MPLSGSSGGGGGCGCTRHGSAGQHPPLVARQLPKAPRSVPPPAPPPSALCSRAVYPSTQAFRRGGAPCRPVPLYGPRPSVTAAAVVRSSAGAGSDVIATRLPYQPFSSAAEPLSRARFRLSIHSRAAFYRWIKLHPSYSLRCSLFLSVVSG